MPGHVQAGVKRCGTLEVTSPDGGGTTLLIEIPV
jgi:hypothetical protein